MLYHDKYVLHNSFAEFILGATAPQQEQLASFQRYFHEFRELCTTTDDEICLIGRTEKDESLLGIYTKFKSQGRIEFVRQNGGNFSTAYFLLGAESIESKHLNLLLSDEFKFMTDRRVVYGSMLPTTAARGGSFIALSSASRDYCLFQDMCEKNKILDMEDHYSEKYKIEYTTWDGNEFDKTRVDNVKTFVGVRHFEQHFEEMITQSSSYSLAVSKALMNGREDPEFAVMYDNKFLSKKTSTFFDIKELKNTYKEMFVDDNIQKYLDNPRYCLIGALDCAVTGDNSIFSIKALESGYGEARKTKLIAMYMLNPEKNKATEHIYRQSEMISDLIIQYKLNAVAIDGSGVGKSCATYVQDNLRMRKYFGINYKQIVEVVITSGNRVELLDYYYNRLQGGLEILFAIPKQWEDEEYLKGLYVNAVKTPSEQALNIIFAYEHVKFTRLVIKDEKTNQVKVEYRQANLNYLHDDSIWSSALCSCLIKMFPTITNVNTSVSPISFNTATGRGWGSRF